MRPHNPTLPISGRDHIVGGLDSYDPARDRDSLYGGTDDDAIWGGAGDDTIDGGTGTNSIWPNGHVPTSLGTASGPSSTTMLTGESAGGLTADGADIPPWLTPSPQEAEGGAIELETDVLEPVQFFGHDYLLMSPQPLRFVDWPDGQVIFPAKGFSFAHSALGKREYAYFHLDTDADPDNGFMVELDPTDMGSNTLRFQAPHDLPAGDIHIVGETVRDGISSRAYSPVLTVSPLVLDIDFEMTDMLGRPVEHDSLKVGDHLLLNVYVSEDNPHVAGLEQIAFKLDYDPEAVRVVAADARTSLSGAFDIARSLDVDAHRGLIDLHAGSDAPVGDGAAAFVGQFEFEVRHPDLCEFGAALTDRPTLGSDGEPAVRIVSGHEGVWFAPEIGGGPIVAIRSDQAGILQSGETVAIEYGAWDPDGLASVDLYWDDDGVVIRRHRRARTGRDPPGRGPNRQRRSAHGSCGTFDRSAAVQRGRQSLHVAGRPESE